MLRTLRPRPGSFLPGLVLIAATLLWAAGTARAQDTVPDWSGEWDTLWPGGGARITFSQDGRQVTGTYPVLGGSIEASAEARRLFGRWAHDGQEGTLLFVQSPDGRTFAGRFGTGAWWTGVRSSPDFDPSLRVSRSTPAETLQSFLRIAGRAGEGSLEWLGRAAPLVVTDPAAVGRASVLEQVALLHRVLERLTFRFVDLPRGGDGVEEVTVRLAQAGTGIGLDFGFRFVAGDWLIVAPPTAELERLLDLLGRAREGGSHEVRRVGDLSSPRAAMQTFIRGMRAPDGPARQAALSTLDGSEISELARARELPLLAEFLFQVIDRVGYVYWVEIPDDPADRSRYVHYRHPEGDVVLAPYEADGARAWRFTPETLSRIRTLHEAVEDLPLPPELDARIVTDPFFRIRSVVRNLSPALLRPLGSLERWQWLGLVLMLSAGLAAGLAGGSRVAAGLAPQRRAPISGARGHDRAVLLLLRAATTGVVVGATVIAAAVALGLPAGNAGPAFTTGVVLVTVGLVPLLWESVTRIVDRYKAGPNVTAHQETFARLVASLLRIGIVGFAALVLANLLEVPYQGVLAGLGIGGLAVALAVQPVLQNFIAGLVLYADRPLEVGDFCRFGDRLGTVEGVGLRSTRIRTLDRTLVTVPNSEFANMELENYSRRDRMWLRTVVQLRYETSPDQLRYLLAELRRILIAHPMILSEPMRVRFIGFGEYALDVEIFAYVATADYDEYLAVREDVFLRIMSAVEGAGCQFAFPSTVEYRADDRTPDPEERARAEEAVRSWRESGSLPFPDFDWRDKASLRNTLDYPPEGSSAGRPEPG